MTRQVAAREVTPGTRVLVTPADALSVTGVVTGARTAFGVTTLWLGGRRTDGSEGPADAILNHGDPVTVLDTDAVEVDLGSLVALLGRLADAAEAPERDETVYDPQGEAAEAVAEAYRDAYSALAAIVPDTVADTTSSAARQHYIDTGRYPATEEV